MIYSIYIYVCIKIKYSYIYIYIYQVNSVFRFAIQPVEPPFSCQVVWLQPLPTASNMECPSLQTWMTQGSHIGVTFNPQPFCNWLRCHNTNPCSPVCISYFTLCIHNFTSGSKINCCPILVVMGSSPIVKLFVAVFFFTKLASGSCSGSGNLQPIPKFVGRTWIISQESGYVGVEHVWNLTEKTFNQLFCSTPTKPTWNTHFPTERPPWYKSKSGQGQDSWFFWQGMYIYIYVSSEYPIYFHVKSGVRRL